MIVFIWILSLTTLDSTQYKFEGTYNECVIEAHQIMENDDTKHAGCYMRRTIPPYKRFR